MSAIYLLLLVLCSCSKGEILSLSKHNVEFASVGGVQEVVINTNIKWEAKSDADWLNTGIKVKGDGAIVIYAQPNYSTDERSAKILVITLDDGIFEEITISQKGENPLQVYFELGTPFTENMDLVGIPLRSDGIFDRPGGFPGSTSNVPEPPWEITGEVKDGIMAIDFPNSEFILPLEYKSNTESLIFGQLYIKPKNSILTSINLHKKGSIYSNQVYILYVGEDFSNEFVTFKRGWNFVEIISNPDWAHGNGEPSKIIGTISQTVNEFLEKGYRWYIEILIGPL